MFIALSKNREKQGPKSTCRRFPNCRNTGKQHASKSQLLYLDREMEQMVSEENKAFEYNMDAVHASILRLLARIIHGSFND